MKKIISFIVVFLILFCFALSLPNGDINGDFRVDENDIILCRNHILRIHHLTGAEFLRADVNNDGKVDSTDLTLIRVKGGRK